MAAFPWIVPHQRQEQDLDDFPHVKRWFEVVGRRAAVQRVYDIAKTVNTATGMSESAKSILFGQGRSLATLILTSSRRAALFSGIIGEAFGSGIGAEHYHSKLRNRRNQKHVVHRPFPIIAR
jgi:hypothetical protein